MIRDIIKRMYFRFSPVRRSTARTEQMLEQMATRLSAMEKEAAEMDKTIRDIQTPIRTLVQSSELLGELMEAPNSPAATHEKEKTKQDYICMQKETYEDERWSPEEIVGNYAWHEEYPYETFLLYRNGDIRKPIFETTSDKVALDFACGPGRMVKRMQKYFKQVDGCDISARLIEEARKRVPGARFYVTSGNDLGEIPGGYDFIYCTISMQHIASHQIRMEIIGHMYEALKLGGRITLQLAYNPNYPYVTERKRMKINESEVRIYQKQPMADWGNDAFDAETTNGDYDVGIGEHDIEQVKSDLSHIFENVAVWFGNVSNYYKDLDGTKCADYWASDWIFIYGEKN